MQCVHSHTACDRAGTWTKEGWLESVSLIMWDGGLGHTHLCSELIPGSAPENQIWCQGSNRDQLDPRQLLDLLSHLLGPWVCTLDHSATLSLKMMMAVDGDDGSDDDDNTKCKASAKHFPFLSTLNWFFPQTPSVLPSPSTCHYPKPIWACAVTHVSLALRPDDFISYSDQSI